MHDPNDWHHDATLLQSDDPEAFGELYDRYAPVVLRFFVVRTACAQTAADLAAETFAVALQIRDKYEPARGSPKSWLMGIAVNQLRHYLRRGRVSARAVRRLGMRLQWEESDLAEVERYIDTASLQTAVRQQLDRLRPALREALELRVIQQLPYAEVAARLGCSQGAARVRVARALEFLGRDGRLLSRWTAATEITVGEG